MPFLPANQQRQSTAHRQPEHKMLQAHLQEDEKRCKKVYKKLAAGKFSSCRHIVPVMLILLCQRNAQYQKVKQTWSNQKTLET